MKAVWVRLDNDQSCDELYLAGERASAGRYQQVGSSREIVLERGDYLPASLDGQVACYLAIRNT